jgi:DNA-binding MarR family transcriptional regulator
VLLREASSSRNARQVDSVDLAGVTAAKVTERHPELNARAMRLAFNFKRAATVLVQREEARFAGTTNRTVAAVRALTMIWMFEPVEARDLATLSGFSRQAISGVLTTLERDGLISRERGVHDADRRLAPISITDAGRGLLDTVLPQQNDADSDFFSVLSEREQKQLFTLTGKLIAAMSESRTGD